MRQLSSRDSVSRWPDLFPFVGHLRCTFVGVRDAHKHANITAYSIAIAYATAVAYAWRITFGYAYGGTVTSSVSNAQSNQLCSRQSSSDTIAGSATFRRQLDSVSIGGTSGQRRRQRQIPLTSLDWTLCEPDLCLFVVLHVLLGHRCVCASVGTRPLSSNDSRKMENLSTTWRRTSVRHDRHL